MICKSVFTFIIFVIVIGILVLVHEWGHFIMARRAGLKVKEFGFGFPPRIWSVKKGETIYSINWLPFGGFVSILGADGEEEEKEKNNERSFSHAKAGVRAKIIIAGVVMNVLLTVVLLIATNYVGNRAILEGHPDAYLATDVEISALQVVDESPASLAGLELLDTIISISSFDTKISSTDVNEFQNFIKDNKGKELIFEVKRNDQIRNITLIPRIDPPVGEGAVGIAMAKTGFIKYSIANSIVNGFRDTWLLSEALINGFGSLIKDIFVGDGTIIDQVAGPIGIAKLSGQAARAGTGQLFFFMAIISINLAILNILPIPPLDGGKAFFIILEKLRGNNPVPKKIENLLANLGFLLLVGLMIVATYSDIVRLL